MKREKLSIAFACLTMIAGMMSAPAMAVPGNTSVRLDCPDIGNPGHPEHVVNYGTYLSGHGIERVGANDDTSPLFSGLIQAGLNIPIDLKTAGYHNAGTAYDPSSGLVTCKYASALGFSPFNLTLQLNNSIGGIVTKSAIEEINIMLQVGLKA